jgi:hypothetical protein
MELEIIIRNASIPGRTQVQEDFYTGDRLWELSSCFQSHWEGLQLFLRIITKKQNTDEYDYDKNINLA